MGSARTFARIELGAASPAIIRIDIDADAVGADEELSGQGLAHLSIMSWRAGGGLSVKSRTLLPPSVSGHRYERASATIVDAQRFFASELQ